MAEFSKIVEPQTWQWILENNVASNGDYFSNIKNAHEGAGANYISVHLDGTGTDSDHRKTTTLMTLNNGVHVDFDYYISEEVTPGTPPRYGYRIMGTVHYKGKDGGEILGSTAINVYSRSQQSPSIDNVNLAYVTSHIQYNNDGIITDDGYSGDFAVFGTLIGQNNYAGLIPGDFPSLNSEINYFDYINYYNWSNLYLVYNWNQFAEAYDKIVDGGDGNPINKTDPDDDTSKPDPGPVPDYDPTVDPIPIPGLPDGGDALSTGFIHAYQPIGPQLQALASKLWSDDFINTIKKVQNDPFEAIISLHSIPVNVAGSSANCVIGNYDSNISMPVVNNEWVRVSLGSYYFPPYFGTALDFAPYNTVDIFLPYIGVRSMQIDDVVGKTITVSYSIDVLSGAAICHIMCANSVLYTYNANVALQIPVTQSSFGPMYQAILNASATVLSGYGAAGAPGAAGAAIGAAINVAMSKQHSISRSGNISGNYGCMGTFFPYLIIHRPKQSLAEGFNHFKGRPSNITANLGSISGYTEIESIHLDGIKCTEAERDEIRGLLYNGVIF